MSESDGSDDAADDGDSGIDKEALREELREKYERDERERESTRRMSDLLLKGATMTNAHCGTCGDPLFTQNATTFCPSCHGGPEGVEGPDLEDDADDDSTPAAAAGDHPGPDVATTAETGPDATSHDDRPSETFQDVGTEVQPDTLPETESSTDVRDVESPVAAGDADGQSQSVDSSQPGPDERRPDDVPTPRREPAGRTPGRRADDHLAGARANVERALEKFAAEAAAADDPRYARDCLEAAREASETLESLR